MEERQRKKARKRTRTRTGMDNFRQEQAIERSRTSNMIRVEKATSTGKGLGYWGRNVDIGY